MVKNKKMSRKKLYFVALLIVILLFVGLYIGGNQQSIANDVDDLCSENSDGDLLCIDFKSVTASQFTILPSKSDVFPYETVYLGLSFNLPAFDDLTSARFQVYDDNFNLVKSWDYLDDLKSALGCNAFTGECSSNGQSIYLSSVSSFKAPSKSGSYTVAHKIQGVNNGLNRILIQEDAGFTVSVFGDCPDDSASSWMLVDNIDGGAWYKRDISTYDSSCDLTVVPEFKTNCDVGYHIKGASTRYSEGAKTCIKDDFIVTCYQCDGSTLVQQSFVDSCGSSWSSVKPSCVVAPEIVTCYSCNGESLLTEDFVDSCDSGWSSGLLSCDIVTVEPEEGEEVVGYVLKADGCYEVTSDPVFATADSCLEAYVNANSDNNAVVNSSGRSLTDKLTSFSDGYAWYVLGVVFLLLLLVVFIIGGSRK